MHHIHVHTFRLNINRPPSSTYSNMSFSRAYGNGAYPWDDWILQGRPAEVIFQYAEHAIEDCMHVYFMPQQSIVYTRMSMEYDDVWLVIEIRVDEVARTLSVERLLSETEIQWPEMCPGMPLTGTGGIAHLKRISACLRVDVLSLDFAARKFFGPTWSALALPLTRPRVPDELVALAKGCPARLGDYNKGPWRRTVGTFFTSFRDRQGAATTIQKHFRGWRIRMRTTFNPHTKLGGYYARRGFAHAFLNCMETTM